MTPRILPGSIVDHPHRGRCSVLSMVAGGEVLKANLQCGPDRIKDRIPDVPVWMLTLVSSPPAIPKSNLRGLS